MLNLYKINCLQIRETLIRPVDLVGRLKGKVRYVLAILSSLKLAR